MSADVGSVGICIRAREIGAETITRTLQTLVDLNIDLYERGLVQGSPLRLRWIPDQPANVSTLHDASILHERGFGSCGELAAAYAAWLYYARGVTPALQLLSNGPRAWHVTALHGETIYDPQVLGVLDHGAHT